MKRKSIAFLLVLCVLAGLAGCSPGVSQEEYNAVVAERDALKAQLEELEVAPVISSENFSASSSNPPQATTGKFDESAVLSQISIEEYAYSNSYWNYAFLVFKNNSEFNLNLSVDVDFFNDNGELIGTKNGDREAFETGTETVLYFMPDEKFSSMQYELSIREEEYFECVTSELSYETTEAKDKVILSITNNGAEAAEFVEGSVLFFNGDTLVDFAQDYFTDNDSELKPGKTIKNEMDCYESFDNIKVCLSGRR